MRDTPETDAVAVIEGNWDTKALRMADFARKLERERDGWREAAYSLGEAIPASWEELQPPAAQLAKFKEMVKLQQEK